MFAGTLKIAGLAALSAAFAVNAGWALEPPAQADVPGETVKTGAQLLKDADDVVFSAQELRPLVLENLPAPIDPTTLTMPPGSEVSGIARTLSDLDPADIPGMARTLGGSARGSLPGAASSHSAGGHIPTLPSAAQNRGRGRGRR